LTTNRKSDEWSDRLSDEWSDDVLSDEWSDGLTDLAQHVMMTNAQHIKHPYSLIETKSRKQIG